VRLLRGTDWVFIYKASCFEYLKVRQVIHIRLKTCNNHQNVISEHHRVVLSLPKSRNMSEITLFSKEREGGGGGLITKVKKKAHGKGGTKK